MPPLPVRTQRCVTGRLRNAYPVSAHDVELQLTAELPAGDLTEVLGAAAREILHGDPHCRRVVFAAPASERDALDAAEAAGFRYVVDVDIPGAELSLFVVEPDWVTAVDMDVDRVPGT